MQITRKPCKKPCPECPYLNTSKPGYFGGHEATEYSKALHSDGLVACHTKSKFDESELVTEVQPCAGHLMSQKLICKVNTDLDAIRFNEDIESSNFKEEFKGKLLGFDFYKYHSISTRITYHEEESE
jgi:hypothetical protein